MKEIDLMSISEFAKFTGLSRSALIFFDENGLFFPERRGENGYRYYSPRQLVTINFVNTLRALDVPLKKIRALAHERTPEDLIELLFEQEDILNAELSRVQGMLRVVSTLLSTMQSGHDVNERELTVRFMPSQRINVGPRNDFTDTADFYRPFIEYCDWARERGLSLAYPIGGYFESIEAFRDTSGEPTRFYSLDPEGREKKPAGRYLVGYSRCYYGEPNGTVRAMLEYARERELDLEGPVYQIYLFDEISVHEHDKYLLQLAVRLREEPPQPKKGSKRASRTSLAPLNS
jgi:DNA-binding transcriptional MerR regulator/effector-binding domain-containing protein